MKKILYLYLLLISAPIFSMQSEKKNQIPMNNKKPSLNTQKIGSAVALTAIPLSYGLAPLACVVSPFSSGTLFVGIGIGIVGTSMIDYYLDNKNKNKDK